MLVRCLYASRSTKPLPASLLDEILKQSRHNNPRKGITGLLSFTSDLFVQVIERGSGGLKPVLKYGDISHITVVGVDVGHRVNGEPHKSVMILGG